MMLKVGPFARWSDAVSFLDAWLLRTRGKTHRIERGVELFMNHYKSNPDISMWIQTETRDVVVRSFFQNAQDPLNERYIPVEGTPVASSHGGTTADAEYGDLNDNELDIIIGEIEKTIILNGGGENEQLSTNTLIREMGILHEYSLAAQKKKNKK